MAFVIRCNSCRARIPWKPTDGVPKACLECGEEFSDDKSDDGIVMPFIRSAKMARTDKVYRDIEAGSERRAELAAQAVGAPVSEMSSLKITNMNDGQREGDIAAKLVPTPDLGQHFKSNGAEFAAGTATGAITVNGQTSTGIAPRAGITAMQNIQGIMGRSV